MCKVFGVRSGDFLAPLTPYARPCGPQDVGADIVGGHKRFAFMRCGYEVWL